MHCRRAGRFIEVQTRYLRVRAIYGWQAGKYDFEVIVKNVRMRFVDIFINMISANRFVQVNSPLNAAI